MVSKEAIKERLKNKLLGSHKHLLWSYDVSGVSELPEEIIIEKLLESGSSEDWKDLEIAFDRKQIKNVWESQMLLSGRHLERQKKIVEHFFHIKNPGRYISERKRKKLNNLIARSI